MAKRQRFATEFNRDKGLTKGFLSPRFARALPQKVNQGMSENAVEPRHCILTTPQRGLTFYGPENTLQQKTRDRRLQEMRR